MSRNIVVVGAGLAGLSASVHLAQMGFSVTLAALSTSERAQSVMAQGGMNAVMLGNASEDTPELHAKETYEAGRHLADYGAITSMTSAAGDIVQELLSYGASLSNDEQGTPLVRAFGGQSKKRTVYAGARTGKHLCSALIMRARRFEASGAITRKVGMHFLRLETSENQVLGAWFFNERENRAEFLPADGIIVASGGLNGLMGNTTGSVENQGAVTASLLSSGVALANLEMIQYHPTTVALNGKRLLVSEAVRGEGAKLFVVENGKRRYFMEEKYPQLGSLMPRDVVSREVFALIQQGYPVFLGTDELDTSVFDHKLAGTRSSCLDFLSIDPSTEPLQIEPGIHFFMGGIAVDRGHRSNVKGLYAAGECACQYHGANRLGANSLLGAIYGGRVAAQSLAEDALDLRDANPALGVPKEPDWLQGRDSGMHLPNATARLQSLMRASLGVIRDEHGLDTGLRELERLSSETASGYDTLASLGENVIWPSQLLLAQAMLKSAMMRRESRGAHQRSDCPEELPTFQKTAVATCDNGKISIDFRAIGGEEEQ